MTNFYFAGVKRYSVEFQISLHNCKQHRYSQTLVFCKLAERTEKDRMEDSNPQKLSGKIIHSIYYNNKGHNNDSLIQPWHHPDVFHIAQNHLGIVELPDDLCHHKAGWIDCPPALQHPSMTGTMAH